MPLLEFRCDACRTSFTWLTGVVDDGEKPVCPSCGGKSFARMFSVFATVSREGSAQGGPCGPSGCDSAPCGGGFCPS